MIILHLKVDNRLDTFLLSYEISNEIIIYHNYQIEISNKKGVSILDTPSEPCILHDLQVYPFLSEFFLLFIFTLISLVHYHESEKVEFLFITSH